jgi:hypothetical protein
MKEYWLNYSILSPPENYMYIHMLYTCMPTCTHTYISALLVWRVLHNSDVIGFVVSDPVIRNVIGLKIGATPF